MTDRVYVVPPAWSYVALIGLIIFFILFVLFFFWALFLLGVDTVNDTSQETDFQQPVFNQNQFDYPLTYNGIPAANVYDLPTARLGVAASMTASNQSQGGALQVPLDQFTVVNESIPAIVLTPTKTSPCPYRRIIAFPDANIFTLANNGPWNQVSWYGLGSIHAGMQQIAQNSVNKVASLVSKTGAQEYTLISGHGAGAGVALAVSLRAKQLHPDKNVIVYVSGSPRLGNNVWFNKLNNNNFDFSNIWVLQNTADNIIDNPLPTMVGSNTYGYTPQINNGRMRFFEYQTFSPPNNHSMAAYAYVLNQELPEPYPPSWPITPII